MKNFNRMYMAALLVCGTYCVSNLYAEAPEIIENQTETVDFDLSTNIEEQTAQDSYNEIELANIQTSPTLMMK